MVKWKGPRIGNLQIPRSEPYFAIWCLCELVTSDVKWRCFQLFHRLVMKQDQPAPCESTAEFLAFGTSALSVDFSSLWRVLQLS